MSALSAERALLTLAALGSDRDTEARRAGLPEFRDADFGWRVPLAAVEALFERGKALHGPDFPLLAPPALAEHNRSPVSLVCRTRQTPRHSMAAYCELIELVTDGYALRSED